MDFIEEAIKIAKRSPLTRHKTGCIIVDYGYAAKIVSTGWSHMSEIGLKRLYSFHAELHALWREPYDIKCGGSLHAYVATITPGGNVTSGKPCVTCALAMYGACIRYVTHTVPGTTDYYSAETISLPSDIDRLKVYARP